MKRLLVLLVMITMLLGIIGVTAVAPDQEVDADVAFDPTLTPTPDPIPFGSMIPGQSSTQSITLTPGTSNLAVTVAITGDDFIVAMQSDESSVFAAYNGDDFTINADTPKTFNTKITVPIGKHSGSYSGTITYSVLEAA